MSSPCLYEIEQGPEDLMIFLEKATAGGSRVSTRCGGTLPFFT
jgi:hypothetical protein